MCIFGEAECWAGGSGRPPVARCCPDPGIGGAGGTYSCLGYSWPGGTTGVMRGGGTALFIVLGPGEESSAAGAKPARLHLGQTAGSGPPPARAGGDLTVYACPLYSRSVYIGLDQPWAS